MTLGLSVALSKVTLRWFGWAGDRRAYHDRWLISCGRNKLSPYTGLFQGIGKRIYTREALLWIFRQCCQYHLLNSRQDPALVPAREEGE